MKVTTRGKTFHVKKQTLLHLSFRSNDFETGRQLLSLCTRIKLAKAVDKRHREAQSYPLDLDKERQNS